MTSPEADSPDAISGQPHVEIDEVVWTPSPDVVAKSRLAGFMASVGVSTVDELCTRANEDPAWFWKAAVADLGVDFYEPYTQVLDTSAGIALAKWWINGRLNVVHSCLDRYAGTVQDSKVGLVWEGEAGAVRKFTYAEIRTQVDELAGGLTQLGVQTGDRVGVFMPMIPEVAVAVLACAKMGAVLVPVFSGYGADAVATRMRDCDAVALICADGFARRGGIVQMKNVADQAVANAPTVRHLVVVTHAGNETQPSTIDRAWDEVLRQGRENPVATAVLDPEDPLLLIYTSGTTGPAKGTVHTHGGFPIKGLADMVHGFDVQSDDTVFWFTDIGWMMGAWLIYGSLIVGATMVMYEGSPDSPTADRMWQLIERHKVTVFGLSPTMVRSLMKADTVGPAGYDLSSLRVVGATGELWDSQSWRWCFEKVCGGRIPLLNYCGGTELAGGILCGNVLTPLRPRSFAGPLPGMFVDVVDEAGNSLTGEVGELVLRGPNPGMTRGFWRDEARYLDTYWSRFPNVWLHGDWAYVDPDDGLWYVLGRSDDTIKVAGKRIGPGEVETLLNSHPDVMVSVAVGAPDAVKGERLVCFVVARPTERPTSDLEAELSDIVASALGKPLRPSAIVSVQELPRTRNSKIVRRAIRMAYAGQQIPDTSAIENPDSLDAIAAAGRAARA